MSDPQAPQGLAPMPEGVSVERKLFRASRAKKWFGATFIGSPQALFGVPDRAPDGTPLLVDFYVPEGDREPASPSEVTTTEFKLRRVAEVWLRRMMIPRMGQLASAFLLAFAVALTLVAGVVGGVKSGWAKHEANVAQAQQEEVRQAQQAAQQKLQAQLAALPDAVRQEVAAAGNHCQQLVADLHAGYAGEKSEPWVQNMGCDPATGNVDVARAAAFVSQLHAAQKSLQVALAAPGTKNQELISQYGADCIRTASAPGVNVSNAVIEGCDPATGRLDLAKAQAYAKSAGGQW